MPGTLRSIALVALVATAACGGSVTGIPGSDGGKDARGDGGGSGPDHHPPFDTGAKDTTVDVPTIRETSPPPDTIAIPRYDGTTGKVCTTDADCHIAGGPNVAVCSNGAFMGQDYYPTAVCILPTCSPVSDKTVHYCDGPDGPLSPGICVPQGTGSTVGICLPKCTYDDKGDPPVGCVSGLTGGNDLCFSYTAGSTGGVGYCWGGCKVDADCQDGQKCQADEGLCMKGVSPPTKAFGAACTLSDTNAGVCNCLYGKSDTGYCSTVCAVGDPTGCPAGATCDPIEFRSFGYSVSNTGMGGYCAVQCTADGGACPAPSSCTDVLTAGPDCIPP
jgi:hypothetical protein